MMAFVMALALIASLYALPKVHATFKMEWGSATSTAETFVSISYNTTFADPIVVVTPEYTTTTQDAGIAVWMDNVSSSGFQFKTSNENLTSTDNIRVHYLVMERGNWTLPDSGIKVEAGSFVGNKTGSVGAGNWICPTYGDTITFNHTFNSNPLVLMTRASDNNPATWGTVFSHDPAAETTPVGTTQMCAGLSTSKDSTPGTFPLDEEIHYVVLDEGNGTIGGVEYEILWNAQDTGDSGGNWINGFADGPPFSQSWAHTWIGTPDIIVVGTTTVGGSDGAWPVLYDSGNTGSIRMFVDEANERAHTGSEAGGGFAFDTPGFYSEIGPEILNASFNDTRISLNREIQLEVNVTDEDGNFTVEYVNATFVTPNGSSVVNYSLTQLVYNETLNGSNQEVGTQEFNITPNQIIYGEAGRISIANFTWTLIEFNQTYSEIPVVIATPTTRNRINLNDTPIPAVSSVNTTHVNITICMDDGSTTCPTTVAEEDLHYFVFDMNVSNNASWLEVGRIDVVTDGNTDTITFNKTFSNAPDMFGLAQTFNPSTIAPVTWFPTITTINATVVACDHPGTGDTCGGTSTETIGYVAIDSANNIFNKYDSGSEDIPGSAWTAVTFDEFYNDPMIMVTVNSETGGQDPKSPMAINVTSTGAEIRYCEQDTGNYCDTHNAETTDWFIVENGIIDFGEGSQEVNKTPITYNSVFDTNLPELYNITVFLDITVYDNSGSSTAGNDNADVELELFNGSTWNSFGFMNITSTGLYSSFIEDSDILNDWTSINARNLRLTPRNMDYNSSSNNDNISWDTVIIQYSYLYEDQVWRLNYSNTSVSGIYNVTSIYTSNGQVLNSTNYTNLSFEVNGAPIITLYTPENVTKIISNRTVEFLFRIEDDLSTINCTLMLNGVPNQTLNCSTLGNTSLNLTLPSGEYNWSVNATDSDGGDETSDTLFFTLIEDTYLRVSKLITSVNSNQYLVQLFVTNFITNSTSTPTLWDFIANTFAAGSYTPVFDIRNETFGPLYVGNVTGWDITLPANTTTEINYSIVGIQDYKLSENYRVGLE